MEKGGLPAVFTDVNAAEYEKLKYMASKAFLENEKRRRRFLAPDKYANYTEAEWAEYYQQKEKKTGRNEHHDLSVYAALAAQAENGEFEKSGLEALKAYILKMIP